MPRVRQPISERFWSHVDRTSECWLWTGAKDAKGYGRFQRGRGEGTISAHRWAWMETHGPIPSTCFLCHSCDTPACVRLDHLFVGDAFANMQDMAAKGRSWMQQREQCPMGHAYDEANTYVDTDGRRRCRTCRKDRRRARRIREGHWQ